MASIHGGSGTADRQLLLDRLREISDRCASRPVLDPRSDDEILGYDQHGLAE